MSSVDNRVKSPLFSQAGTTRSQCDEFAERTFGGPIEPVSMQGVYSYTVVAANAAVIVQFRENSSPLDISLLETVRNAHPDFVASCRFHGTIGSSSPLRIYSMDKLQGDNYLNISLSMPDDSMDRLTTVRSLARFAHHSASYTLIKLIINNRFFTQSWKNCSRLDRNAISVITETCNVSFDDLSLPAELQQTVRQVQDNLPSLFSGKYPLVVTHGDLSEMNILADPKTGEITGIIDWAEASIQPFGFALYALDNIIGYLTPGGWVFHNNAGLLRDEFWRLFSEMVGGVSQRDMELIRLARLAGLFLRYGLPHKPGRQGVLGVGVSKNTFQILRALVQG